MDPTVPDWSAAKSAGRSRARLRLSRIALGLGVGSVLIYAALALLLFLFQDRLVFGPSWPLGKTPEEVGLDFERVAIETSDGGEFVAWWIPSESSQESGAEKAVLLCHGNAGNIGHRLHFAEFFHSLGLSALLFDYRGFGDSPGEPSEAGTYLDAQAAYDFIVARGYAPEQIVVFGESLGAAVAIDLALQRPVARLVTESAFQSVPKLGSDMYPWLPVRWLARTHYASVDKAAALRVPWLIVHSPDDTLVPFHHGEALLAQAGPTARLLRTEGDHNDGGMFRRESWRVEVSAFLLADDTHTEEGPDSRE